MVFEFGLLVRADELPLVRSITCVRLWWCIQGIQLRIPRKYFYQAHLTTLNCGGGSIMIDAIWRQLGLATIYTLIHRSTLSSLGFQ